MKDNIKELLTLAAKACGQEVWFPRMNGGKDQYGNRIILEPCLTKGASGEVVGWAPHLDDGDGARMEEKLGIEFEWHGVGVASSAYSDDGLPRSWREPAVRVREAYADHNNDRQAARRWASLRAAAQIGRGVP